MKLKFAKQIDYSEFEAQEFDIIIAASGYESRAIHLVSKLRLDNSKLVLIRFMEKKDEKQRKKNDKIFQKLGFDISKDLVSEGSYQKIIEILDANIGEYLVNRVNLNILIDYSCMTRVWYATIINYFLNKYSRLQNLNLFFSYSPAEYTPPLETRPNQYMGPIPSMYRISTASRPTALIIGLGYEKYRAIGLTEYIDPKLTYLLYSNPAFDTRYIKNIEKNNEELIESVGTKNVFTHPIGDLVATESLLTSLYLSLRGEYIVIIAPLGPKPFALLSLLLASRYPDIDVWRVSSGGIRNVYDRKPRKIDPVVCQINLVRGENSILLEA